MIFTRRALRASRLAVILLLVIGLLGGCSGRQTATPPPATASADMLALVNGLLIDGTGTQPVPDAALLIQGETILAVGPQEEVDLPKGVRTLDLQGAALLPGLINVHVHNTLTPALLEQWAQAGVTTVRDVGAPQGQWNISYRQTVNADPYKARLLMSGPLVTVPSGYPTSHFPSLTVSSPQDAELRVTELLDQGVDLIKISLESTGGPVLSQAEVDAIVAAAHARNIPVAAHVHTSQDAQKAISAGVDDIDHMFPHLTDAQIQVMLTKGIYWVPTITFTAEAGPEFKKFVQAHGQVAMGNDAGYLQGGEIGLPLRELVGLTWFDLTPLQVITIATLNGARLCQIDDQVGTLETGKVADILVVDGDPSQDISALANVRLVIHNGVVIRSAEAPAAP